MNKKYLISFLHCEVNHAFPDFKHLSFQYEANRDALMMEALRTAQGLHMPMRLQMERQIAAKVCSHMDK